MSTYSHLNDSSIEALGLSDADRILKIRSERWIGYPKAKQILAKLEDLLIHPRTHRMPNLLIVGDTNNGKTMLVQRFKNLHPAIDNPSGEGIQAPVLLVQAPPIPDEGRFTMLSSNCCLPHTAPASAWTRNSFRRSNCSVMLA